jgi:hypothetical protein
MEDISCNDIIADWLISFGKLKTLFHSHAFFVVNFENCLAASPYLQTKLNAVRQLVLSHVGPGSHDTFLITSSHPVGFPKRHEEV